MPFPASHAPIPRILTLCTALIAANLLAWGWALLAFRDYPILLGTALLAYSLGLRHAVDADHIAAIDNVTRKLMQAGRRPIAVGFYFSLGHSTVVVLVSLVVAASAATLEGRFASLKAVGGLVGTGISALFLFAIAAANLATLRGTYRLFRRMRHRGGGAAEGELDLLLPPRGLLARLFRPLFRLVGESWQMYPLGFLFGLGFDTATEIGLLGIAAAEAAKGLPLWSIMVFPALFTAGMSLIDTADGILMLGAYGWAFVRPMRKLYYNLAITSVSVLVALAVGSIEALGLVADRLGLSGGLWDAIGRLNDDFGTLGFLIVGIFVAGWIVSVVIYRMRGYDRVEVP